MILDVEYLQKVAYERSKAWSSFMEQITNDETLEEIAIAEIAKGHNTYCDEDEDELASMEDSECSDVAVGSDVLKNITNNTRFSISPAGGRRSVEQNELIDAINQTAPIIIECNRQLKEFGLDKILKSFDKKEIEEKVGGWLNRHNSLYGGDNTLIYDGGKMNTKEKRIKSAQEVQDSDDSLQSGETARYIRSSKIGTMKKTASTTTMIKTHKVKSSREALRGNFVCEANDDRDHLKFIRRRKVTDTQSYGNTYDLNKYYKSCKYEIKPFSSLKQRRKVFRKRMCSISCSSSDSSSESDFYYGDHLRSHPKHLQISTKHHCSAVKYNNYKKSHSAISVVKRLKTKRQPMIIPSSRMDRLYFYSNSITQSLSSSPASSSFGSLTKNRNRMAAKLCNDKRPCKRESDCACCDGNELCSEYRHVADVSTEEWNVENCCSPKKPPKMMLPKVLGCDDKILYSATEGLKSNLKSNKNKKKQTSVKRKTKISESKTNLEDKFQGNHYSDMSTIDCYSPFRKIGKITAGKTNKSSVPSVSEQQSSKTEMLDENLKNKSKLKENGKPIRKISKHKSKTSKPNTNLEDESQNEDEISDFELKTCIEISKKSDEEEQRKKLNNENVTKTTKKTNNMSKIKNKNVAIENNEVYRKFNEENNKQDDSKSRCLEMTAMKNANSVTNSSDDSLFTATHAFCNSTALSTKSKAYNRQIFEKLVEEDEENITLVDLVGPTGKENKSQNSARTEIPIAKDNKVLAASTTVSSTSVRSSDINSELTSIACGINELQQNKEMSRTHYADYALVTSTTNIQESFPRRNNGNLETTQNTLTSKNLNNKELLQEVDIVIYTPEFRNNLPANSFTSDGSFTVTEKHLSSIVGEKVAEKFIKYYVGCRRFDPNSTVYFRPPPNDATPNNSRDNLFSDSSDDLDYFGQCGELYAKSK